MIKLAAVGLLACVAAYANIGFLQGPMNVAPIRVSPRTEVVQNKAPSHEIGDADTEEVEILRHDVVMPALHVHAAKPSKPRVWTCGPMEPMAGAAHGKASAFYGNVSRCEWK